MLFAVALVFVMLYSALFIAAKADHECVGENCLICQQLQACQTALKTLSLAVSAVVFAAALAYALGKCLAACADAVPSTSLVALKVKLSN